MRKSGLLDGRRHPLRRLLVCGLTVALAVVVVQPITASAATVPARTAVGQRSEKPFRIKAGKPYVISSSLSGVHAGDRQQLQVRNGGRWHGIASAALSAGQRHFSHTTATSHPALYTLRLAILRGGRVLAGSQSNSFQVRVLPFRVPAAKKPHGTLTSAPRDGEPVIEPSWNSVICGYPVNYGLAPNIDVVSPLGSLSSYLSGPVEINQLIYVRSAVPNGTWGPWQGMGDYQQVLQPGVSTQWVISTVDDGRDRDLATPEEVTVGGWTDQDLVHQVAWNMQVHNASGWQYINTSYYTPNSYIAYDSDGVSHPGSSTCETFRTHD